MSSGLTAEREADQEQTIDEELASFVSDLSFRDIPEDGVRLAERCFVDTVGVTLAGSTEGAGRTAARMVRGISHDGPVSLIGSGGSAPLTEGVFVNGTAGHGLDYDDVVMGVGHPSVPLVAPILGVAEANGASGKELITAFVAGYETEKYLAAMISDHHYARGWHSTSTFGTFGATSAVANLLGLDEGQTKHALNIAASMPAGLKKNFGTMTKPMHVGQAARSGVTAALLAAEGFTGAEEAIADDYGFLDIYSGGPPPNFDARHDLGERWMITEAGVNVKKYPCCYGTHTAITAAAYLADEHGISPESVASVHVTATPGTKKILHYDDPDTGLEGKFSMPYTVASAIARDRVGLAAFDDENVDDPAVQSVREKIEWDIDPDLPNGSALVRIESTSGETFEHLQEAAPGTHDNPLSNAEMQEKFMMCAERAIGTDDAQAAHEILDSLRTQADVAGLFDRL